MKRAALGLAWLVVLLACASTWAAGPRAVRRQVEASMLVIGRISIDGAGNVSGYSLHQPDKLPKGVTDLVDKVVPGWKFEPVLLAGEPVNATADMSIRFVAKKADADNYSVELRSAAFGDAAAKLPRQPTHQEKHRKQDACPSLRPPNYPQQAAAAGVMANVYMLVKADREGKPLEAIAEQVNLKVIDSEHSMERWRRMFVQASVARAKEWCFAPLQAGSEAKDGFQVLRVPVVFHFEDSAHAYGRWESYVPGPRQRNPWEEDKEGTAFSPDVLPPGAAYRAGSGLKLLTRLSEG